MYNIGNQICWDLEVTNTGPFPANSVVITDQLPIEITFSSLELLDSAGNIDVTNDYNITTGELTNVTLAVGETKTYRICGIANTAGTITNSANITDVNTVDPDLTDNDSSDEIVILDSDTTLTISKTSNQTEVNNPPIPWIFYNIELCNSGTSDAINAQILDILDPGYTDVTVTVNSGPAHTNNTSGNTVQIDIPVLQPNECLNVTIAVHGDALIGDTVVNIATGSADNADDVTDSTSYLITDPNEPSVELTDDTGNDGDVGVALTVDVTDNDNIDCPSGNTQSLTLVTGSEVNINFTTDVTISGANIIVTPSSSGFWSFEYQFCCGTVCDTTTVSGTAIAIVTGNDACNCPNDLEAYGMLEGSIQASVGPNVSGDHEVGINQSTSGSPSPSPGISVSGYSLPITISYTVNGGAPIVEVFNSDNTSITALYGTGDIVTYEATDSNGNIIYTGEFTALSDSSNKSINGQGIWSTGTTNNCAAGGGIDVNVDFYTNLSLEPGDTSEISYDNGATYVPFTASGSTGSHTFTSVQLPFNQGIHIRVKDSSGNVLQDQGSYFNIDNC